MPANRKEWWIGAVVIAALIVLVIVGQWRLAVQRRQVLAAYVHRPSGVMGTECAMVAVLAREDAVRSEEILHAAEAELRHVEVRMSNWLEDSEVSRLCDADDGVELRLSEDLREVLRAARDAYEQTGGAFDVTCRPQLELWRRVARATGFPTEAQVAKASAASGWKQLDLTTTGL